MTRPRTPNGNLLPNNRQLDRLGDVVIHAGRQTLVLVLGHGIGRHGDDDRTGVAIAGLVNLVGLGVVVLANGHRGFDTGQLGHLHIHKDDVKLFVLDRLHSLQTIVAANHILETQTTQHTTRQTHADVIIFYYGNRQREAQSELAIQLAQGSGQRGERRDHEVRLVRQPLQNAEQARIANRLAGRGLEHGGVLGLTGLAEAWADAIARAVAAAVRLFFAREPAFAIAFTLSRAASRTSAMLAVRRAPVHALATAVGFAANYEFARRVTTNA